jgi:hypothetical protein
MSANSKQHLLALLRAIGSPLALNQLQANERLGNSYIPKLYSIAEVMRRIIVLFITWPMDYLSSFPNRLILLFILRVEDIIIFDEMNFMSTYIIVFSKIVVQFNYPVTV